MSLLCDDAVQFFSHPRSSDALYNINLFPHNHLIYLDMANIKNVYEELEREKVEEGNINVCTLVSKLNPFIKKNEIVEHR